jgi:hypothetical protein
MAGGRRQIQEAIHAFLEGLVLKAAIRCFDDSNIQYIKFGCGMNHCELDRIN